MWRHNISKVVLPEQDTDVVEHVVDHMMSNMLWDMYTYKYFSHLFILDIDNRYMVSKEQYCICGIINDEEKYFLHECQEHIHVKSISLRHL